MSYASVAQDNGISEEDGAAAENVRPALPYFAGLTEVQEMCGPIDDSQHVEFYEGNLGVSKEYVQEHQASTMQLQWIPEADIVAKLPDYDPGNVGGKRWCTGTLLDDRHVLTAGHCFDPQDGRYTWITPWRMGADKKLEYSDSKTLASLVKANFNYQLDGKSGAIRQADEYPVIALLEWRDGGARLDYAIIELGQNAAGEFPGQRYPAAKISIEDPKLNDPISIIQHPKGEPKKIEVGAVNKLTENMILYADLDTFGASSGSAIRDSSGIVVGVHTAGGCMFSGYNRGIKNSAIAKVSKLLSQWAKPAECAGSGECE